MEWFTVSIPLVLTVVCPIWIYLWLIKSMKTKRVVNPIASHYTVPEWNFFLKRWWAAHCIRNLKRKNSERVRSFQKITAAESNYIKQPPKQMEEIRTLKYEDSSDSIFFYATDQKKNFLFINITRRRHRTVELILQLTLADGRTYQLPNHPDCTISNNLSNQWSAGGLKITPLEPWRRWRITFNGLLRNGIRRNYHQDVGTVEHIRFHFIYSAADRPLLWPQDCSTGLQADALAREPWKDPQWIDMIKLDYTGGYDQWGSLTGQITFEDSSINDLYLRGLRQRRWGKLKSAHLYRTVNIVGTTYDGAMYCLGANSSEEGLTHMPFGHVKQPDGSLYPIDRMDFDLAFYAEQRENIPTRHIVNFEAGGKKYNTVISRIMETGATLYGGRPWDWEARVFNTETQMNDDKGFGLAYLWYNYNGSSPLRSVPRINHLIPLAIKPESDLYTVAFEEQICRSEVAVGGKGSSIALLTSVPNKEFIVPRGFCVTVSALNLQIEKNEALSNAVTRVEEISHGKLSADLKLACETAVALFEKIPVIEPIQAAIKESILRQNKPERFAVRSSAVGEDGEETSAAGQNATFLGLKSTEQIIKAVAKCWGSLYAYQSVEYRRQRGQPVKAEMGVCVQEMVNAEAAGVLFTRHPTSGDPKQIVITANYGLGESVVSAMIEPDTIIIKRNFNDTLAIKDVKLGKKAKKILMSSQGEGTITEKLDDLENDKICISEEIALRLGNLGVELEKLFGTARDIEWAVVRGEIFLLQSRPITALDAWTDFEIIHELDSPVPSEIDVTIFSNIGEVLPGATSPLSLSTVLRKLNSAIEMNGMEKLANPCYENSIGNTGWRCNINYIDTMLRKVEKKVSLGNKIIDIAVCGHTVTTPELHASAMRRNGLLGIKFKLKMFKDMITDAWNNESIVKQAEKFFKNFKLETNHFIRAEHLYREINDNLHNLLQASMYHSHTSRVSVFCQVLSMSILVEGGENFTSEHYSDVGILLSSCNDVVSAQVPNDLRELAQTIRNSEKAAEFIKLNPSEARNWLILNCTKAEIMFDDFLKQHGHRSIREMDLMTETWEMKPENLLATLQASIRSSGQLPRTEDLTAAETVDRLVTPKRSVTRKILKKLVPLIRSAVARRELTKAILVSVINSFRLAYRKLSKLMVEEGRLPDANLIFFLTHQEIGPLLIKQDPTLIQKAIRRRRLYPYCDKVKYPEVNVGVLKPIIMESKTKVCEGGARVAGTPVCGGSALGRACVITDLNDAVLLKSGDILITHSTDIGWSPYFPILGGVVTELGGLISHGAVVAREYGLPCIVGAEGATQIFSTGETVLLSGTTGVLQTIEDTE